MKHWYAVHTRARQERIAAENLMRQSFETYLPYTQTQKRRANRWQPAVEPLFPGYVFVRLDLSRDNTAPIRSTRGAVGLVRFGSELRPVPDVVIDALMEAQPSAAEAVELSQLFQAGDRVRLVDGALAGLNAIVEASSGLERVAVLIELLGRPSRVVVSPHQLVPAY